MKDCPHEIRGILTLIVCAYARGLEFARDPSNCKVPHPLGAHPRAGNDGSEDA
jgi:hypothetical protein